MFIELSVEDPGLWRALQLQAEKAKEGVCHFKPQCFRNKDHSEISDERITFDGHGSLTHFAKRTPQDFVKLLTHPNSEYKLPNNVKIIDLVGCNIGLRPSPNQKSYVEEFAQHLHSNKEYSHIQINAFIHPNELSDDNKRKYDELISFAGNNEVYLLTPTQSEAFNEKSDQLLALDKEIKGMKIEREGLNRGLEAYGSLNLERIEKYINVKERLGRTNAWSRQSTLTKQKEKLEKEFFESAGINIETGIENINQLKEKIKSLDQTILQKEGQQKILQNEKSDLIKKGKRIYSRTNEVRQHLDLPSCNVSSGYVEVKEKASPPTKKRKQDDSQAIPRSAAFKEKLQEIKQEASDDIQLNTGSYRA